MYYYLLIILLLVVGCSPSIPHVAKFERNMCYVENGIREPWQTNPDGIIVTKGYQKYLVMLASEADRLKQDKIGAEVEIETFDAKHHEAICPTAWLKHNHK